MVMVWELSILTNMGCSLSPLVVRYLDPSYDIRIDSEKPYDGPSPLIGFRVIAVRKM